MKIEPVYSQYPSGVEHEGCHESW